MASPPRIAFKAGRAFRREGTNWVDPQPDKGAIILQNAPEDGLLQFIWKNRSTSRIEEELTLFPSDASFEPVPQAVGGRVYVLKFESSDAKHFFWLQDADTTRDKDFVQNVNRLLTDPSQLPIWFTGTPDSLGTAGFDDAGRVIEGRGASSSSQPAQEASSSQSAQPAQPGGFQFTQEQLNQFQSMIQDASGGSVASALPEISLSDILTPANISPLFTSHPELIQTLFPYLPPDLPRPPTPETLQQIINSPQFRGAVRSLDQALRTGLLGGLVRGLGLPEEAGTSVEAFLRAIQEQASSESGADSMDTD